MKKVECYLQQHVKFELVDLGNPGSKALLLAIKLARPHGYDNIILESNSQVLVTRLYRTVVYIFEFE